MIAYAAVFFALPFANYLRHFVRYRRETARLFPGLAFGQDYDTYERRMNDPEFKEKHAALSKLFNRALGALGICALSWVLGAILLALILYFMAENGLLALRGDGIP